MSGATKSSDFTFEPKVWSDHAMAYFDKKLVYGGFALKNDELKAEGSGLTVNFPYYKTIGEAEEPEEDESLTIDNLSDDSFSATVFEIGKAVGIKKKAFKKSADSVAGIVGEAQRQLGRVHAEKVDAKLNDELLTYDGVFGGAVGNDPTKFDNMTIGFTASASTDVMNVRNLLTAKIRAFGDKSEDAVVCFMHSLQWLDSQIDTTAGFLKADANDPLSAIKGFTGRLFNMAIVVVDSIKKTSAQIDGKDAYVAHFHKMN